MVNSSKNVYNEDEYVQFSLQLEEKIKKIQEMDCIVDEKIHYQIKVKENECLKKKEEIEDLRKNETMEKNEFYNRKIYRSPEKEDFEKAEESNKIRKSDRDLEKERQKLEIELREKQEKLIRLVNQKTQIEKNLEEKYQAELKGKQQLTVILLAITLVLSVIYWFS
jgi:hypothetical protein